jgi:hypoxanthine phosphoribosyltransferase
MSDAAGERLVLLYSRDRIHERVKELAAAIRHDYTGRDLVVIGVLKGAFMFAADLIRELDRPVGVDFVTLSSYGPATTTSGVPAIVRAPSVTIQDKDVLVIEDIVDSGLSMKALLADLGARSPRSVRLCALLDKRERRVEAIVIDYVGFEVPSGFVVGYGIDYAEKYRYLSDIYRLEFESVTS